MAAMIIDDLFEINRRLCFNLWSITDVTQKPQGLSPRLILPQKRNQEIRISEQEARFLFCGLLNSLNYFFSVETPTTEEYQQTGQTALSARSDVSLYVSANDDRPFRKVANVEFKAHNPPQAQIRKDVEKLIKENLVGNWIHTLKNSDAQTLPKLFDKFIAAMSECVEMVGASEISIVFCFCVLEKKWACIKHFHFDSSKGNFEEYVQSFFDIKNGVNADAVVVNVETGWRVFEAGW